MAEDTCYVFKTMFVTGNRCAAAMLFLGIFLTGCVKREKLAASARKKGREVSARQWELAGWTVLVTDLPADRLDAAEAWELYRARWQIELLFKLWKQGNRLSRPGGADPERALGRGVRQTAGGDRTALGAAEQRLGGGRGAW